MVTEQTIAFLKGQVLEQVVREIQINHDGKQVQMQFTNGWGASVISDGYGRDSGLYEVAVLDSQGKPDYSTPIADNVIGWLDQWAVYTTLFNIASLPPAASKVES